MKPYLKLLSLICAAAVSAVTLSACSHEEAAPQPPPPAPMPTPAPASQPGS